MKFRSYFTREQILTLPNLLSLIRLLLIPVLVWAYLGLCDYPLAAIIFTVSTLTDIVDGFIARRFNMTSDFGKALDPFADKLTQLAVLFCLVTRFIYMLIPLCLLFVKEIVSGIASLRAIKKTGVVKSAEWHGKVTTVTLFLMIVTHILWYDIPPAASYVSVGICIGVMLMSFVLYSFRHFSALRDETKK